MPSFYGTKTSSPLQLHSIVEQPLTPSSYGRIRCSAVGLAPIRFQWKGPGKEVQVDSTGSEAYQLSPGRYIVRAESADGLRAELHVDVAPVCTTAVVVSEYLTTPATSGVALDGSVRAVGHGLERWKRYLWSNGTETSEPVLRDVRPGWYSIVPLPVETECPPLVHECAPARVGVGRLTVSST